jgi:hypothetical protein
MGFLDNLENSLKSLETQDERDPNEHQKRQDQRAQAVAIAPWADQLKTSDWTLKLFDSAAAAGHRIRAKVYMAWFENTLRLEARTRVMEVRPTTDGIIAEYERPDGERVVEPVNLNSNPEELLSKWLG